MFGLFLLSNVLSSFASNPDFLILQQTQKNKIEITATPPAKHHFNINAPMAIDPTNLKPTLATAEKIQFTVPANANGYSLSLYLCDNANTYCEKHVVRTAPASKEEAPKANLRAVSKKTAKEYVDKYGFIMNNPKSAFDLAKDQKMPLMIDFYGIWCPPCNMLDEEVYASGDFKKKASHFVKLKLDADDPVSWELKSKYKITGYPTVIFTTWKGEEIFRIVGFDTTTEHMNAIASAWENRDNPGTVFKKTEEAESTNSADILQNQAEEYEKQGQTELAKETFRKAAKDYRAQIALKFPKNKWVRGYNQELAYCLWKSGDIAAAEKIYQKLQKKYPSEFTFYFSNARMNQALKRFDKALPLAQKAYRYSYGDNRLRTAELLAQTFKDRGENAKALAIVQEALQAAELPEDAALRTHRYYQNLKTLEQSLE